MNFLRSFILLFFLIFSGIKLTAQVYKPLLAQFNEWHVTNCNNGCITDVYYTDADTVINGLTYSILDGFHYISRGFLLREDVAEKQVFMLLTGIGKEDVEYLLYDFSLAVGDSMLILNPISPLPDTSGYFKVDSIVPEVLIDGDTYRHFYLSALDSALSQTGRAEWIEGIGSLALINTPGAYPNINTVGALSCFFNNLTLHYSNLDSISACIQVNTDLGTTAIQTAPQIAIFPNPSFGELQIHTDVKAMKGIRIFDLSGRIAADFSVTNSFQYKADLQNLLPGIYMIEIVFADHQKIVKKIILE
ncbi:MAG: T9SS type A sorting domain-containing protein [Putridiphycobacter sp.]|nr:T9SS type A sorting domain-containing protein [Putridiphycobacter sp.]